MNLPVSGATSVIGLVPAPDQTAVPGFAQLVTALLAGSDVISEEVTQPGAELSIPGQEEHLDGPAPDDDFRAEIGLEAPWPALMVHPSLVADALLRHLDQVGTFGVAEETPLGASPIETGSVARAATPPTLAQTATPPATGRPVTETEFSMGAAPLVPIPAPATPIDPEAARVETSVAPAPPRPSAVPTRFEPSETGSDEVAGGEAKEGPLAPQPAPPAGEVAISTRPVFHRPTPDLRTDPARPRADGVEGLPTGLGRGGESVPIPSDGPTDGAVEIDGERSRLPIHRAESQAGTAVAPTDRTPRDAEPHRIGLRPAEALSTAARRVEEAVRQLEAAPPPSVVTMVIEELDLRLTVALRPDGVHLSAPGPVAQQLIGSLEEALHARGFDLSGRQRDRHGREQPEAPVNSSPPRPTTRPASGLRL